MSSVGSIHLVSNFSKNWKKGGGKKGEVKTQNTQEDLQVVLVWPFEIPRDFFVIFVMVKKCIVFQQRN
jgi:hypothetical protein